MPAFKADPGMPYWVDLTTSDPRRSAHFYGELLDWEISGDDYRIARVSGLPVAGFITQPEDSQLPDTWLTYFLSGDIAADVARATELGGRVLAAPMAVSLGEMAVLVDPAGALFGFLQPADEEAFIAAGEPGTPVWHELTATAGFDAAVDYYGPLMDWTIADRGPGYATALVEGYAIAGLRNAQGHFPPQVPSFWQSYLGVRDIDAAAAKVPGLGGEIIRGPFDSEFGRLCLIADSTGATVMLCQVADYVADTAAEGDDVFQVLREAGLPE